MKNNFDETIKKRLENLEPEYQPSDWDLMEEKIKAQDVDPDIEDVFLDGVAYDSLHDFQPAFNPSHWELMRQKLEDPYAIRRKLVKYKVAEIALVALFIFTLFRFLPFNKSHNDPQAAASPINMETSPVEKANTTNQDIITTPNQALQGDLNNNKIAQNTDQQDNTDLVINRSQNEAQAINKTTTAVADKTSLSYNGAAFDEKESALSKFPIEGKSLIAETSATNDQNISLNASEEAPSFNMDILNPILLKEDQLHIPGIEEINSSTVFSDLKQPLRIRIGMALGPDANFVMTPIDKESDYDAFDQVAAGYSGGFTLGFQYNRLEIETGAIYSAVTYGSRNIFEIRGSFAEGGYVRQGLQGAELDLIRLPLNLKYNFFEKSKWNFYAMTGSSLNMAVETFYDFTTENEGEYDRNAAPQNPRMPDEYQDKFSRASNDGVFEGGSLSKNLFLTANVGFGVERYFTPRMSIFLQPSYQYQFTKGLGPQNDQINTISILTGAKVTLKKRKKSKK